MPSPLDLSFLFEQDRHTKGCQAFSFDLNACDGFWPLAWVRQPEICGQG
jgi:hypothetical protein